MKRLVYLAARLYPRTWRDRYGAELEALIEDDPRASLFDVLKGAVAMTITHMSPRPLIAGFALLGLLVAVIAWAAIPNVYRSTGTAAVPKSLSDDAINAAASKALSDSGMRGLISRAGIVNLEIEQVRQRILISKTAAGRFDPDSKLFTVAFDSPDPNKAQAVASDVLSRLTENLPKPLLIVDAPARPQRPLSPYLTPMVAAGVLGGALCGLLFARIPRLPRQQER